MPSTLRPPSHRGPLIAAGATVLTVGVVLQQARLPEVAPGWQALVCGALAALLLLLAVGAPLEGGRPPAYQSVLIVCGLVQLAPALVHLADALGADLEDGVPAGTGAWVSAAVAAVAGVLGARRNSGIAAFACALASVGAVLFAAEWVADPGLPAHRWLSLGLAIAFVLLSLILRAGRPRHSEQLVNAAGLLVLSIPLAALGNALFGIFAGASLELLPGFWELVVLAAGFGLVSYAAADRAPGAAYLGAANLAAFAAVTTIGAEETLEWWPFLLLGVGALMLLAGLRPARPLPPEPEAYAKDDVPLHSRVEGDERIFTIRD